MPSTQKIKRILRQEYPGTEITHTDGGHLRLVLPNGAKLFISATPSDEHFFWRNVRADIRRKLKESTT